MDELRRDGLDQLHRDLVAAADNTKKDELPLSIRKRIDELGLGTQELLVNCPTEMDYRTPLLIAAIRGNRSIVRVLLEWNAVASFDDLSLIIMLDTPNKDDIIRQILDRVSPMVIQRVFWLSCQYNEAAVAEACLELGACPDSPLRFHPEHVVPTIWEGVTTPTPALLATSLGHAGVLRVLQQYGADMEVSDDEDISCLTLAAYGRHTAIVEHLISKNTGLSSVAKANAYELLGAAHVIAGDVAAGKGAWKKAIAILEKVGSHKSRYVATSLRSLDSKLGFRTAAELDKMRAKEFRVQALIIFEHHLFGTRLFLDALLATPYTIDISIEALFILLQCDKLTLENLYKVQLHLEKMGLFKAPDINKVMHCLEWCIAAVGHLRELTQVQPICMNDIVRFKALVGFICQVLVCLERCGGIEQHHTHLHHLLRRIVGVCYPMAQYRSLLHELLRLRLKQKAFDENNVFALLIKAGADMVVVDRNNNTLLHEVVLAYDKNISVPKELIKVLVSADVPIDATNRKGISVRGTICRVLDCTG